MKRRSFIKKASVSALMLGTISNNLFAGTKEQFTKLTILHTNDLHSRILPFPKGSRYEGLGGAAKRAQLIKEIRAKEKNVLLFDSGDIFQGTPFFNQFGGELELKLMSEMAYDASTLGNHDFDAGLEGFEKQLHLANFPFLNVNYSFDDTILNGKIEKYKVFEKEGLKIGVFGLGIELNGLVPEKLYKGVLYEDPVIKANETAFFLKNKLKCDYVVCLSHLGLKYNSEKISDVKLAKNSQNIDLILGGHTHSFLDEPMKVNNLDNAVVAINQVGWAGILLGRLEIYFEKNLKKNRKKQTPVIFSKKTIVK
ncbi:MAG: bifunctional metallophosphatase/5'-nucleotidase [Chitinophagales bacterium]